jgi:hypothetical protein
LRSRATGEVFQLQERKRIGVKNIGSRDRQFFFAFEIIVEGPLWDFGPTDNILHAGPVVAELVE